VNSKFETSHLHVACHSLLRSHSIRCCSAFDFPKIRSQVTHLYHPHPIIHS